MAKKKTRTKIFINNQDDLNLHAIMGVDENSVIVSNISKHATLNEVETVRSVLKLQFPRNLILNLI